MKAIRMDEKNSKFEEFVNLFKDKEQEAIKEIYTNYLTDSRKSQIEPIVALGFNDKIQKDKIAVLFLEGVSIFLQTPESKNYMQQKVFPDMLENLKTQHGTEPIFSIIVLDSYVAKFDKSESEEAHNKITQLVREKAVREIAGNQTCLTFVIESEKYSFLEMYHKIYANDELEEEYILSEKPVESIIIDKTDGNNNSLSGFTFFKN